ncbi:hypothetical protein ACKWTF_004671 [Chironomus riparius]
MLSTSQVRRYFSCISFLSQGIFMLFVAYVANAYLVMTFISFGAALGALSTCGYAMNHLDIAPQFSSFVRGISSTIGTIPGIVAPLVAGLIVNIPAAKDQHPTTTKEILIEPENDDPKYEDAVIQHVNQWKNVFIVTAHVYFLGCIFYWFYSSGEVQPWAILPEDATGISNAIDIESNKAEKEENIERPARRRNKNGQSKKGAKQDSLKQPNVHKSSTKNSHKSPDRSKDNRKNKIKNDTSSEALKIGARLLKMYDRFANYLSRMFRY